MGSTLASEVLKLIFFWWWVIKVWHGWDLMLQRVSGNKMMLCKAGWKFYMSQIDMMKRIQPSSVDVNFSPTYTLKMYFIKTVSNTTGSMVTWMSETGEKTELFFFKASGKATKEVAVSLWCSPHTVSLVSGEQQRTMWCGGLITWVDRH